MTKLNTDIWNVLCICSTAVQFGPLICYGAFAWPGGRPSCAKPWDLLYQIIQSPLVMWWPWDLLYQTIPTSYVMTCINKPGFSVSSWGSICCLHCFHVIRKSWSLLSKTFLTCSCSSWYLWSMYELFLLCLPHRDHIENDQSSNTACKLIDSIDGKRYLHHILPSCFVQVDCQITWMSGCQITWMSNLYCASSTSPLLEDPTWQEKVVSIASDGRPNLTRQSNVNHYWHPWLYANWWSISYNIAFSISCVMTSTSIIRV